jgi:hypothetical protein
MGAVVAMRIAGIGALIYNPFAGLPAPEFSPFGALVVLLCAWPAVLLVLAPRPVSRTREAEIARRVEVVR